MSDQPQRYSPTILTKCQCINTCGFVCSWCPELMTREDLLCDRCRSGIPHCHLPTRLAMMIAHLKLMKEWLGE